MKNRLLLFALSLFVFPTINAQSYYVNSKGEKIEAEILSWSLSGIKIHESHKKRSVNAEDIKYCIIVHEHGRDSIAKLENTGMLEAPPSLLMKVLAVGKIIYYFESHWEGDEYQLTHILFKNGAYQEISVTNEKWKDFFADNKDLYDRINALKHHEYTNTKFMAELVREYDGAK
jgi:hypothetical protein